MKKAFKKMLLLISAITIISTTLSSCNFVYHQKTNKMISRCENSLEQRDFKKSLSNIIEIRGRELTQEQRNKVLQLEYQINKLYYQINYEGLAVQGKVNDEKQIETQKKTEEKREMRNLKLNPPTSVSDLRNRIEGTVWIAEHDRNDVLYPKYEFRSGKVFHYVMSAEGGWFLNDSFSYTVKDEEDFYSITFGDGRDLNHLTTSIVFVKSNGAVACFVHETGEKGLLYLENY